MVLRDTLLRCKFCLNFVSASVLVVNYTLLHELLMLNISLVVADIASLTPLLS